VLFNIESKVNPVDRNQTRTAAEFVNAMAKIFVARGENVIERITHQSFDVSLFSLLFFRFLLVSFLPCLVLLEWWSTEVGLKLINSGKLSSFRKLIILPSGHPLYVILRPVSSSPDPHTLQSAALPLISPTAYTSLA